ncbi:DinB family protein [Dyella psychrodurans]|uniref:Damage-inducible protein DinB n=1 Tax=Dyella psychrodurans TaxID=1927960 RepID=A0A370WWJ7_9GAMM|nr:DinB family protein [Dyella psychrodurans]RDS80335.1 damage-inducible protein DinB [Dyella psychrodurans]
MSQLRHLQMLTRYRAWADRLLYQSLAAMPEAALTRAQPIVFGSILRTLNHAHCMDLVWKAHLEGVPHGFTTRNPEDCPAFAELRAAQAATNDWYIRLAETLDAHALDETIHFTFIGGGQGSMRRGDIVLHVVNHATYHRGHVAMMMYGMSTPPPTTDLPVFLREEG